MFILRALDLLSFQNIRNFYSDFHCSMPRLQQNLANHFGNCSNILFDRTVTSDACLVLFIEISFRVFEDIFKAKLMKKKRSSVVSCMNMRQL